MAAGWWSDYSYECEECSYEDTPQNARMVRVCWVFWLSKHIEFFDTVSPKLLNGIRIEFSIC